MTDRSGVDIFVTMSIEQPHIEHVVAQSGAGATYGGAALTGVSWAMSFNGIVAITGLVIAFAGFCVNFYFSLRRDARQREQADRQRRIQELEIEKLERIEESIDRGL